VATISNLLKPALLALIFIFFTPNISAENYIIHAGKVIDGIDKKPLGNSTIVVKNGLIVSIDKGFMEAKDDEILVDLKQQTVLPGLMDMHVHLSGQMGPKSYGEGFFMNDADFALRATTYAKKTLLAGFTTVRDLGAANGIIISLRKAISKGWTIGPRIFAAGKAIGTTGGHADPTNNLNHKLMGDPGAAEGVINGPIEARKAVRQRYKEGSDVIKITGTGGVLSMAKSGKNPQFTDDELKEIVATAKDYGMIVAVHAHGKEGMRRAIVAGVDSIEHGTFMDKSLIKLMKKYGTYYVPTIMAGDFVAEKAKIEGFFPEIVRPKAAEIGPLIKNTFAKAYKAGVKIAFGTDSGVSAHGDNAYEFQLMTEAGMTPMDAIQSATINAAKLLKVENRLGSIGIGKIADIIAVYGDPIEDIKLLQKVDFVMKDGVIVKHTK
jgi:imidazolonepropionase-like amidohydrolase